MGSKPSTNPKRLLLLRNGRNWDCQPRYFDPSSLKVLVVRCRELLMLKSFEDEKKDNMQKRIEERRITGVRRLWY